MVLLRNFIVYRSSGVGGGKYYWILRITIVLNLQTKGYVCQTWRKSDKIRTAGREYMSL